MKDRDWQYDPEWGKHTLLALLLGAVIILAVANGYKAGRIDATAGSTPCPPCATIPTPGTEDPAASTIATATPESLKFQVMKPRVGIPTGFQGDPVFWGMLTPEGQVVLSAVTLAVSDEPRSYACPQAWEVGGPTPTPAVCTYYGGVYEGDTNTIGLWGEAAQANPDILRHEALHALDAAGDRPASENGFLKIAGELAAEALYNASGGTWFRPNELYAMVPLLVGWEFDRLPPTVAAFYAEWFVGAQAASAGMVLP